MRVEPARAAGPGARGSVEVPLADLVLLGVQVLLAARSRGARARTARRPGRRCRSWRRGWRRARPRPRTPRPPVCRYSVRMSGVLGQKFGRRYSVDLGPGELGEVLAQLPRGVAPGEVGVGLAEAELGQALHDPGPGEGLGQEDHVGVLAPGPRPSATPRRRRAWCGGCRPGRSARPRRSSSERRPCSAVHSASPVGGVEVDRVDVLVPLRRVLGELDRAVGPVAEPLGVLGDPGVVGRALEGEVQRDLEAVDLRPRRRAPGSRPACRARGGWRCGRPRPRRWPRGCRGRPCGR